MRGRGRIWLGLIVIYAGIGIIDGIHDFIAPPAGAHPSVAANLAVAFCAGLFWPIDIIARPLLTR